MGKSHTLKIEIEVSVKKSPKVEINEKFLREAVAYWVESGVNFPGVKVTAVLWQRDGGRQSAARSEHTIDDARANMLRRLLHHWEWRITATPVGTDQRAGAS